MLDSADAILQRLVPHLRLVDLLDVALVAVAVYMALVWLRRAASRPLLVTLGLLLGLYFVAHAFDMYLSSLLFQVGFTAIVLGLVLIFQEDIRRGLESLTAWGTRRDHSPPSALQRTVDTLTETIARLADMNVGALLVFVGRQPLERHIRGGVRVRGEISLPLLHSIFDPHSPGHDGAVLIRGNRIELLGVHLPLSENLDEVGPGGTRHTAALGLAERSDALVVVVSEERGTISIASAGRLHVLDSAAELKARLEDYYEGLHPEGPRRWAGWLTRNLGLKALSLATACLLWFAIAFQMDTVQATFEAIPVYSNLPEGWVVVREVGDQSLQVTVSGPQRAFRLLNRERLILPVDMSGAELGPQEIAYPAENLTLPPGLQVTKIRPNRSELTVYRTREVTLPVQVTFEAKEPPEGFVLADYRAEPQHIRVSIRDDGSAASLPQTKIPTDRIDLSKLTESQVVEVGLNPPEDVDVLANSRVKVHITLAPRRPETGPAEPER